MLAGALLGPGEADSEPNGQASAYFSAEGLTRAIQYMLVWTGDYTSDCDGLYGAKTETAVRAFQHREGLAVTGVLRPDEIELLFRRGEEAIDRYEFEERIDRITGVSLGVPFSLVDTYELTDHGVRVSAADGSVSIETMRFEPGEMTLRRLGERYRSLGHDRRVEYEVLKGSKLILMGTEGESGFYMMAVEGEEGVRGFSITFPAENKDRFLPVCVAMANTFVPFPELPLGDERRGAGGEPDEVQPDRTGSGFFVTDEGHVITNKHVIEECGEIRVTGFGAARLIAVDDDNDLALLAVEVTDAVTPVQFRERPPALGETVYVFGFPMSGVLDAGLNVTSGVVSSLKGLGGDERKIQVTAPVQDGNSGGPLIDAQGRLIGIVVGKISALVMLELTGDLPQNVNFAIRAQSAEHLMRSEGIEASYGEEGRGPDPAGLEVLSVEAERYTVHIGCVVPE